MLKEGTKWELKSLKIAFLIFGIISLYFILDNIFLSDSEILLSHIFKWSVPVVWIPLVAIGYIYLNPKNYPYFLFTTIIAAHLGTFFISLGGELHIYYMEFDERVGQGAWVGHIFRIFFLIGITALFFSRLWAVLLWLLLSLMQPMRQVILTLQNPNVYFESDWNTIISDGWAINSWILRENITFMIFFLIIVLGIFLSNRNLVKSMVKAERANAVLGRYFSPEIKDEIEQSDSDLANQKPKDLDVAILFTDIVGFTKLSEKMDPKDVLALLSEYQSIMIEAIFENKGTVDKFIGDAVMANFGTPKSHGNDAQNAFDCALAMNKKLKEWNASRLEKGLSQIEHRIGIHYGPCVVGNTGSDQRTEFAVIGDPVNVASRICDACKQFDTNFIISENVADRIGVQDNWKNIKNFEIRGRKEKLNLVKIYS